MTKTKTKYTKDLKTPKNETLINLPDKELAFMERPK